MLKFPLRQYSLLLLACALFCIAGESLVWACPNCKDGLASDPQQASLVRGLFWSILFLLSMPFLITAGLGGYFYYLICKARKAVPVAAPAETGSPFSTATTASEKELEVAGVS